MNLPSPDHTTGARGSLAGISLESCRRCGDGPRFPSRCRNGSRIASGGRTENPTTGRARSSARARSAARVRILCPARLTRDDAGQLRARGRVAVGRRARQTTPRANRLGLPALLPEDRPHQETGIARAIALRRRPHDAVQDLQTDPIVMERNGRVRVPARVATVPSGSSAAAAAPGDRPAGSTRASSADPLLACRRGASRGHPRSLPPSGRAGTAARSSPASPDVRRHTAG